MKKLILVVFLFIIPIGVCFGLEPADNEDTTTLGQQSNKDISSSNWTIAFDNDDLIPGSRDRYYTYGFNLTSAGQQVENQWASLHQPLGWINEKIGLDGRIGQANKASKIEYGLFGFTPEDISFGRSTTARSALRQSDLYLQL